MTFPPLSPLLAVLLCATLFVLLFQYIFPRPAPWRLVAAAVAAGLVATLLLAFILHRIVPAGLAGLDGLTSVSTALPFAVLRAGLPEEATKALAALAALLPFWRRATPAQAFQAALFAAVGFAIVENQGYASRFGDFAILIAFGRGFLATLTHTLLAMIFGAFLMRFVAGGWCRWHLLVLGYLAAVGCHALYDSGLLPLLSEYLRTGDVTVPSALAAVPFVVGGIALVLVAGLWSLRGAIRRSAAEDPLADEPRHQARVRRWRWSANTLLVLGLLGLAAAVAWAIFSGTPEPAKPDLQSALALAIALGTSTFAVILSWVLRQKR
jgi:RsiW-degrading membrane proteinase PrsW (M82 family)